MKNRLPLFLIALFLLISCIKTADRPGPALLNRLNWSEENFGVLNQLIRDYGIGGKYYEQDRPPYAVLDWDQTCAHLDVEEALMRYQMFHLRYKLTKEQFAALLHNEINGVTALAEEFGGVSLADIHQDLISDYSLLYDRYIGPGQIPSPEELKNCEQYQDFTAKLPFLYAGYCETAGIGDDYGYPWVLYLLAGHTTDEVKAMAREAISAELGNSLAVHTLESPAKSATKVGVVRYSYKSGLRVLPEMQDLIATFMANGIDVFIVSASFKPVVEVFSGEGTFGYNVPTASVIGMELKTDENGVIFPEYKEGWVKTYGQGKVEAIKRVIQTEAGRNWDPLFSAGDSNGDYEMSTGFPEMKLSLIWDRGKGGKIGELCQMAREQESSAAPRYILQGRNENAGIAIPVSASVLLGQPN
ncbi:MAG: haloacid dehalogenase-like hydrolase [Mangrovibacterium sp.]